MKSWLEEMNGQGSPLRGLAIWSLAAAAVLSAHAAGAAYLMRERPEPIADETAGALMLELAPMATAQNTEEDVVGDAQEDTAEVKPPPEPEPEPEEIVEEEPPPEVEPEPEVAELEEEIDVPVEAPEVVIPKVRPEPRPERKVVEKPREPPKERVEKPRKPREQAPSVAQNRAAAQVSQANRNASATSAGASGSSAQTAKWTSRLQAHLQRHKRRFKGAAREDAGVVQVRVTIDTAGNVLSASVARSSGMAELDENALATVRRASPVPPPPDEVSQRTFIMPLKFDPKSFR